jgi:hypothetical protein
MYNFVIKKQATKLGAYDIISCNKLRILIKSNAKEEKIRGIFWLA